YYVQLGHIDGIVFTAGLGENDAAVRSEICALLTEPLGITLDEEFNKTIHGKEALISDENSSVPVWVIPTNEELVIARDTVRLLNL
ncbi:MAG: acetate kinase, partial [Erysipelotrichaceae bacterium]|nr:acetate kinase [Erysipelotrichaceae bacterium]